MLRRKRGTKPCTGQKDRIRAANPARFAPPAAVFAAGLTPVGLRDPATAHAQGRLDARYTVTLAGMPIGKGAWVIDIAGTTVHRGGQRRDHGAAAGLRQRPGAAASRGISPGQPVPATYRRQHHHRQEDRRNPHDARLGDVKDYAIEPPRRRIRSACR